ncbi:MAG: hypothetical protein Q4C88_08185 [Akkermansia sp.]|nr:hypothetical protein [Akkermansia sp.]
MPASSDSAAAAGRMARAGRMVGSALGSRSLNTTLLLAVIAVELAVLGVGMVRRLELANQEAMRVSEAQIAAIEAQSLQDMQNTGSGSIGTSQADEPAADANKVGSDAAPPLRSMDAQILLARNGALDIDRKDDAAPAAAVPDAAAAVVAGLTREQRRELDRLIRQGVSALTAGDMRLCILSLEQGRAIAPEHPALLYYYGLAYDKLDNREKARAFYTQVFEMRDKAGKYFQRAAQRLSFGYDSAAAMRGKLSFGPYQLRHTTDDDLAEHVDILLPVLLAPGEEVRPDDIYITIQFFDLVDGRKIEFSRMASPQLNWQNEQPTWADWEENLLITYSVPPLTPEEEDAYGSLKYYGFTAKLYYKGEPLDCISTPASLILQEQRLNSRKRRGGYQEGLLPDDGLVPGGAEEALPVSDYLNDLTTP